MATFVLDVLDAANVSSNSSTVTISDNTFIQISVDDDDSNFDGDSLANEVGNDTNQFLTGTTDQVYLERVLDITDGVNTWTIADVESGGGNLGWAVVAGTEPLPTGSFTVTAIRNVTESSNPIDFSDVGIPCLTRGTLIDTTRGAVAVEELEAGDMVITRDAGPQPVRWVGSRTVDGAGRYAPVRIAAGALGNARDLLVSPNHRMVVEGRKIAALFDTDAALVAANLLINDSTIRPEPMAEVEYFHVLFDRHQVIFAEGAATESFHPGEASDAMSDATRAEILELFPHLE
ncbi:MAG: Hint domain-containing protein, partial [Pseudomonadota bacterium]